MLPCSPSLWYRAGSVTDRVQRSRVRTPGSTLTSRIETNSQSRVVRDSGDPCSETLIGWKKVSVGGVFFLTAEQPQLFSNDIKANTKIKEK